MSKQDSSRVTELDGLRGLAIGLVVWFHLVEPVLSLGQDTWQGWLRVGTNLSWSGVDLFFVLSGFFIGGVLIDQRASPRLSRVFYLRRALRILPLYYVTLAACMAAGMISWIAPHYPMWVYGFFLTNLALSLTNVWDAAPLSPLWSLAVEEQFYLSAPWVVRWVSAARLPWLLLGLIVAATVLRVVSVILFPTAWMAIYTLTPMRMDLLAMGGLIAWAVRAEAARPFFVQLGRHWTLWLASASALWLAIAAHIPEQGSPFLVYLGYPLLTVGYGLLVAIVAGVRPPALLAVLRFAPIVSLGRYSYFIYLWHMLIGAGVFTLLHGPRMPLGSPQAWLAVAVAIAATWVAAAGSFRFFESPLIALGHRHRY